MPDKETVYDVAVKLLVMAESPFWCKTAPREDIANELRRLAEVLRKGLKNDR
jgi:hypothetical protein